MNVLVPEANLFSNPYNEVLFECLAETATEMKKKILSGPVDALVAEQEGNGDWGFFISEEGAMCIWLLVDIGTVTLAPDGTVTIDNVPVEEDWVNAEGETEYDYYYRILGQVIPTDLMPEKLSEDDPLDDPENTTEPAELGEDGEEDE